ncbi:MAG: VWA domain-containing protein [Paracoccaceae bacterium]
MTDDDLDALRAALKSSPLADPAAKSRAMMQAMENFDRRQGTADSIRPSQDRPRRAALLTGVLQMLKSVSSRPVLAGTASAAALCLGLVAVLPQWQGPLSAPQGPLSQPLAPDRLSELGKALGGAVADMQAGLPPPAQTVPLASPEGAAGAASGQKTEIAQDDGLTGAAAPPAARKAAPATAAPPAPAPAAESYAEPMMEPEVVMIQPQPETEAFANADASPVKITAEEPVSTFSIDVDTASYAVVRSSLNAGILPDPDQVRVEEMVNYFPYSYPAPEAGQVFRPTITVMPTPWNAGTRLVHVAIQGALPEVAARPPLNLVFLIDTSGSMQDANKLPLLKQSLALMLPDLRPEDRVAIVAYAGSAGEVLPPTPASDRAAIMAALDRLDAGGSTAGAEGIALAYQVARGMARDGAIGRVLLATDGDFNIGIDDPEKLKDFIAAQRSSGIYLSVLGFGRGNLDDATMQALAQNGNGTASYIDTLGEARKVLVDQMSGALFPIADDVKIQIEWNPATVAEYRLIGYETRALRREDFNNDKVDAGEIGAGTAVTAIYEVTAPGSPALLNDPLRYARGDAAATDAGELGLLRLRWKAPGTKTSVLREQPIPQETAAAPDAVRFGVAIAGFGQLLRHSVYLGDWGWDQAIALASGAKGDDPFGYRAEAVGLMRLAQALSR